tara:strand:+ start:279 stop:581 length:303 start_codon:yes stop_codon:yes gene_type:complete
MVVYIVQVPKQKVMLYVLDVLLAKQKIRMNHLPVKIVQWANMVILCVLIAQLDIINRWKHKAFVIFANRVNGRLQRQLRMTILVRTVQLVPIRHRLLPCK